MDKNKDIIINGKALYTPKGAALEYGRIGCNFYTGCPHVSLMGFSTFTRIEPVIDWSSAERIIMAAITWCDHFKLGLRSGVKSDYYDIAQSVVAIMRIVQAVESFGKTIYLKDSTRQLLQQYLLPGAYETFLTHTVGLDGKPIRR